MVVSSIVCMIDEYLLRDVPSCALRQLVIKQSLIVLQTKEFLVQYRLF